MTQLAPLPRADTPAAQPAVALPPPLPRLDPIERLPVLILFPHSRCNCRCLMCDIWRVTTKEELTAAEVEEWLPEWRRLGVERVLLSGGEPLLHSELETLCRLLHEAGIGITVHSTGLLLRRDAATVARYCDHVVVSLDGPREVHDAVRRIPRAYDKLADGVAAVRALAPSIEVTGRCTLQRSNFRHLRATVRAARAAGLDKISFLAADVSTDAFNRPDGWEEEKVEEVALAAADLPDLEAELDALEAEHAEDLESGFIAESPAKLRDRILRYYAALAGDGEPAPVSCNAPWVSSVIETDGTVRPCFFQPPLGNLREAGSMEALLNSAEAVAWRRGLDTHRDTICRKCVCSLTLRESPSGAHEEA